MSQVVEFDTNLGKLAFEVDSGQTEDSGLLANRTAEIVESASQTFEQAFATLKAGITNIVHDIREIATDADELTVQFGIKAGLKYGICISGSADANISVKLTYKRTQKVDL